MQSKDIKALLLQAFGHLVDKQLMALTIYGEARGEGRDGKIAVGSVILERVEHRAWDGETVQEVCLMPYQFSCYLPGDPNLAELKRIAEDWDAAYEKSVTLRQCYEIACGLLEGTIERNVTATQYLNPKTVKVMPEWTKTMRLVAAIGHHVFYS